MNGGMLERSGNPAECGGRMVIGGLVIGQVSVKYKFVQLVPVCHSVCVGR